ncbi:MAG: hypothetical protein K5860_06605 [Bacteroidales bacterium]|nr:hypothetical protein [Bacteroidales bacterium]
MKKTLIIVAVIAVVAVVAFLLLRKKDEPTDDKNVGVANPNAEEKSEEELLREQQEAIEAAKIEAARKEIEAANSVGYATQEDLEATGVILTAEEKREQQDLANRYYNVTKMSAQDMSLDALRQIVPEVEKAKAVYDKLKNEFPNAGYDIDYSKIVLGSNDYDTEEELLTVYKRMTDRDAQIKQLAADFVVDLQDGIVWSDGTRVGKKIIKGVLNPISLFTNSKDKDALWEGYRGWTTETMREILALSDKEAKQFEKYFKTAYTDFYFRPKDFERSKVAGVYTQTKQNAWSRANAQKYSKSGLNSSNATLLKLLTYNGKDKGPHDTRYFRDRDSKSGVDYSVQLFNKFSKLK